MDIRNQNIKILADVGNLAQQLMDEQYTAPLEVLAKQAIGKHVRHIVEFHQCLLNGLANKHIDYDSRERNILLETDRIYTCEAIKNIAHCIEQLSDEPLLLAMNYGDGTYSVATSVYRELAYNIEHSIHHLAIIKIGIITHFPQIALPPNFGVAHSTIIHQQQLSIS
ncbi:MAG: hypothetical protein IPO27_00300 [Bacteroidetes bacterium]|nr:hypothetical protein [Bacteroidota bacterium]